MNKNDIKFINLINPDYLGYTNIVRHAARGIIIKDNKILLSYEEKNNQYLIPGGGVEKDESLVECCEREVLEETGICCLPIVNYLDINELFLNMNHINHYFVCKVINENQALHLTELEKEVNLTFIWIEIEKALEIFGQYEKYKKDDLARFGLYRREFLAIKSYIEYSQLFKI